MIAWLKRHFAIRRDRRRIARWRRDRLVLPTGNARKERR